MSRIRSIKPEMYGDDKIITLSIHARYLFVALLNYADDAGRARSFPKEVESFAFPADDVDIANLLEEIASTGMIHFYRVKGVPYFHFVNWARHQKVDRPRESYFPAPDNHCQNCQNVDVEPIREVLATSSRNIRETFATTARDPRDNCVQMSRLEHRSIGSQEQGEHRSIPTPSLRSGDERACEGIMAVSFVEVEDQAPKGEQELEADNATLTTPPGAEDGDTIPPVPVAPPSKAKREAVELEARAKELLAAFRSVRFPSEKPFTKSQWGAFAPQLKALAQDGYNAEQVRQATKAAMERWTTPDMVNPRSMARNISSLLESSRAAPSANGKLSWSEQIQREIAAQEAREREETRV